MVHRKRSEQLYKVAGVSRGSKLTPSKKVPGALSPLVHGKGPGIKSQVVLIPVASKSNTRPSGGKKRSALLFLTKALLWVAGAAAVFTAGALLIAAVVEGVSAGFAKVGDTIAAASEHVVVGAGVVALVAVGVTMARFFVRRHTNEPSMRERSSAGPRAAVRYVATPHYASEGARTSHVAPANWYPDPSNTALLRYWNGTAWTYHTTPRQGVAATPANWFPDPSNAALLRYWNGTAWTHHTTPRQGTRVPATRPTVPPGEPRLTMSSDEWQDRVRAWLAARAIGDELWGIITHAHIQDADPAVLEWQIEMRKLTPQQLSDRVRLTLEANPTLRDDFSLTEFMRFLGIGRVLDSRGGPVPISKHADQPHRH